VSCTSLALLYSEIMEHPMGQRCILIVEDDPDIRAITQMYLGMEGFNTLTAENGKEALEILENGNKLCLILLDLMMPVMDGWAFAEAVSKDANLNQIPIVVATAFAEEAHTVTNAKKILKKPVTFEQLKNITKEYCGKT